MMVMMMTFLSVIDNSAVDDFSNLWQTHCTFLLFTFGGRQVVLLRWCCYHRLVLPLLLLLLLLLCYE